MISFAVVENQQSDFRDPSNGIKELVTLVHKRVGLTLKYNAIYNAISFT